MQNSTRSGLFDNFRRKRLRAENLRELLERIKKRIERKIIKSRKLKSLKKERAQKSKLANLRFAVELRKKMDAVKQNIRKSD